MPEARSVFSPSVLPITVATLATVSLVAFDGLAVAAALPGITEDLGSVGLLSGVLTGFLLASSIATIATGPLVDALGVRKVYRVATVGFGIATLACGLAPSMVTLVAARVGQGACGGALITAAISTVGLAYPERLRSRAFAANSTVWGTMSFLAPGLAALLLQVVGWRAIFLMALPLVAVAAAIGWNRLPDRVSDEPAALRVDAAGLVLLGLGVGLATLSLSTLRWWTVAGLALAVVALAAYWRHAGRRREPVLERCWLAELPWWGINLGAALGLAATLGVDAFITIFVSAAQGRSGLLVALSVVPLSIGWTGAALATSRLLDHYSETGIARAAYAVLLPSLAAGAVLFGTTTPLWVVWAVVFAQGVGVGMLTNSMLTLLQARVAVGSIGRASSAHSFLRNGAHTVATAVSGAVLLAVVAGRVGDVDLVQRVLSGERVELGDQAATAVADGYRVAHVVAFVLAVGGALSVTAARRHLSRSRHLRRATPAGGVA